MPSQIRTCRSTVPHKAAERSPCCSCCLHHNLSPQGVDTIARLGTECRLRALVHDALAKHLTDSAAFFADKLATLSGGAPADVYLLCQVGLLL